MGHASATCISDETETNYIRSVQIWSAKFEGFEFNFVKLTDLKHQGTEKKKRRTATKASVARYIDIRNDRLTCNAMLKLK